MVCSRVRELQEAGATIALEISSRNSRVVALQKCWDRLRAGLDLILDQRGADMADLPGGASGIPVYAPHVISEQQNEILSWAARQQ